MNDWMLFCLWLVGILSFLTCFMRWCTVWQFKQENNLPWITEYNVPKIHFGNRDALGRPLTPVPGCTCGCNDIEPVVGPQTPSGVSRKLDKIQQILREELHRDDQNNPEDGGEVRH